MDEQRLRARLAALDIAQQLTGFGVSPEEIEDIPKLAGRLEEWLMRPGPSTDVPEPDEMSTHFVETTADRLGYDRCPTAWRDSAPTGPLHHCRLPAGHAGVKTDVHICVCGVVLP
jgi:hypothetical protein